MVIGNKKRGGRDREFKVEEGASTRIMGRMDTSEWNIDMRGNEGVDIRKIKEGGESLEMIAMVRTLANQKPHFPPCPRTRRHCRPNEDPEIPFMLGNGSLYSKLPESDSAGGLC